MTAQAAQATAQAAKSALDSAQLAEASAKKTAAAARVVIQQTRSDQADADTDVAMSEVAEVEAHENYRQAQSKAAERTSNS